MEKDVLEINATPFMKFEEMIYIQAALKENISGIFLMWVGINYPGSPPELKCFAIIFMSMFMPSKLSNKDYGGPGTESCCIQGIQEMTRECVSLMVTYTEHPSGYQNSNSINNYF